VWYILYRIDWWYWWVIKKSDKLAVNSWMSLRGLYFISHVSPSSSSRICFNISRLLLDNYSKWHHSYVHLLQFCQYICRKNKSWEIIGSLFSLFKSLWDWNYCYFAPTYECRNGKNLIDAKVTIDISLVLVNYSK
jgi:hypothetical protein